MHVIDKDGVLGVIASTPQPLDALTQAQVTLPDGEEVLVPVVALQRRDAESYYLPFRLTDLPRHNPATAATAAPDTLAIPVMEETLDVQKRAKKRRVRITKRVREHEELVDEPAHKEEVTVERVAINRAVDGPVPVRQEGDTLIIPLLEEVVMVEKRLVLREELHVTRHRTEQRQPQRVKLRREEASVERHDADRDITKP